MILTVLIIIAVVILTVLLYLTISFLLRVLTRKIKVSKNFSLNKKYKYLTFVFSGICAIAFCSYYFLSNPAHNYKTAYIEKSGDKYTLTLYRQRSLMAHDPISLLQRKTYLDSAKFELPKSDGIIDGADIIYKNAYFNFLKGSNMKIKNEALSVNLEYISNYDSTDSKLTLNGIYSLKWRR